MKSVKTILLLFTLFSLVFANAVIVEWKAEPETNKIVLQWKTSQEDNVRKFVVERSTDNKTFTDIGEVIARGAGYQYNFEDSDLGKLKSIFYYRLRVVNIDGSIQHTDSLPVIPNLSSISRTWGSIKALFR